MIKTFENCSPEYQITIICFFIFLTLLYMILVIYGRNRKKTKKDVAAGQCITYSYFPYNIRLVCAATDV